MIRNITAAITGIVTAFLLVMLIEMLGHSVYPPPPGLSVDDMDAIRAYIETAPVGALLFPALAYIVASFCGTLLACYIGTAKPIIYGTVVGGLMLVATVANLIMIPHPLWFSATAVIGIVASTWFATRISQKRDIPD